MFMCPNCGSTTFVGHQSVRIDVVVNGDNEYVGSVSPDVSADIYDSEEPYGPYRCSQCDTWFDELGE